MASVPEKDRNTRYRMSVRLRWVTTLVHRWRQFPFAAPDLPPEMLPDTWPRAVAAQRFADLRAEVLPAATRWWDHTEAAHTPA